MPRPKKFTLDFFIHDANASINPKVAALSRKHGNDGYAVYFRLLESLCQRDGLKLDVSDPLILESIAEQFRCRDGHHLVAILQTCSDLGLLNKQLWESERIVLSDGLYGRYLDRLEDRKKAAIRKQQSLEAKKLQSKIDETEAKFLLPELQNSRTSELQNTHTQNTPCDNSGFTRENPIITSEKQIITRENPKEAEQGVREGDANAPKHPCEKVEARYKRGGKLEVWEVAIGEPDPAFVEWVASKDKSRSSALPTKTKAKRTLYNSRDNATDLASDLWQEYQEEKAKSERRSEPPSSAPPPIPDSEVVTGEAAKAAIAALKQKLSTTKETRHVSTEDDLEF